MEKEITGIDFGIEDGDYTVKTIFVKDEEGKIIYIKDLEEEEE